MEDEEDDGVVVAFEGRAIALTAILTMVGTQADLLDVLIKEEGFL